MNVNRTLGLAIVVGFVVSLVGCAGRGVAPPSASPQTAVPVASVAPIAPASPAKVGIDDPPVTLRAAVADESSAESDLLVKRVAELSGGRITITPVFSAGGADYEVGVARLVRDGGVELALTSTRAFDLVGISSLQFLQAPFLIDNDALSLAVARSDIAQRALDQMGDAVGLTIWPIEVRHLQAFPGCDRDFRTPAGVRGATIFSPPSGVSRALADALGAKTWFSMDADRGAAVRSCEISGAEAGITSTGVLPMGSNPTAIGDVTVYPKFGVLAANAEAFRHLSEAQRGVIRQAAADVGADAITRQAHDAGAEAAWCEAGGRIVLAGPNAQADFLKAAAPVYAELDRDPLTRNLIADVRALAATTAASPHAQPCEPSTPDPDLVPPDDLTGYVGTAVPDGTYRRELVLEDLLARGVSRETAENNSPTRLTIIVQGTSVTQVVEHEGVESRCDGTSQSVGGVVRWTSTSGPSNCEFGGDAVWRPEPDGISFVVLPHESIPRDDRALLDHWIWTRIN